MKKRLLSLLLVLVMVLMLVPVTGAETVASGTCGENVTWTLEDGTLTISGSGAMTNYTSNGHAPWYDSRKNITKVVIENGVTTIGRYAFVYFSELTEVTIPSSVKEIVGYAFGKCSKLNDVTIPSSVTTIGDAAFTECAALAEITIPSSVTTIGDHAFSHCTSMTALTIPASVTAIGNNTFICSTNLTSVTYEGTTAPDSGINVFTDTGVTTVNVPADYSGETFCGKPVAKAATTYTITIADGIANGTVTADKATAAEGNTVTLTVTPDEGYELDNLKVMQGETEVTVTNNTFTMPAGSVAVSATFKQSVRTYFVKVYDNNNREKVFGEYQMQNLQGNIYYAEVARSEFDNFAGDIGYDFLDNEGNRIADSGSESISAGKNYRHYLFYCDVINDRGSSGSVQVFGPEGELSFTAKEYLDVYGPLDFGEPVRLKKKGNWPEDAQVTIEVKEYAGDQSTSTVVPLAKDGQDGYTFTCDELVYKVIDTPSFKIDYNKPSYWINVNVEYKASIAPTTNGEVTVEPEYVEAGETFTVTATPDSGYVVDTITVTDKDGNEVEPNEDGTYTMYAGGVTVTATFKKAASSGDQGGGSDSSQQPSKPSYPTYWPIVDETTVGGAKAGDPFTVLCRKLNVRAGAGTQFEKIGSLHRGEVVKGKDLGNGWIEIEYEGRTAYISAQYVEMHSADCEKDVTVICRKLNVRTGAGTEYRKIGSVTRGEVLCVVSESNGWYEVLYQDGTAWICAKYAA